MAQRSQTARKPKKSILLERVRSATDKTGPGANESYKVTAEGLDQEGEAVTVAIPG